MNIFGFFKDGGVFITYPILILLLLMIFLWVKAIKKGGDISKAISLIASISWFTLAWGYFGRTLGLIGAFDKIAAAGDITPSLLAGSLKMALLGPLFGLIAFLIARLGIIVLKLRNKNNSVDD